MPEEPNVSKMDKPELKQEQAKLFELIKAELHKNRLLKAKLPQAELSELIKVEWLELPEDGLPEAELFELLKAKAKEFARKISKLNKAAPKNSAKNKTVPKVLRVEPLEAGSKERETKAALQLKEPEAQWEEQLGELKAWVEA